MSYQTPRDNPDVRLLSMHLGCAGSQLTRVSSCSNNHRRPALRLRDRQVRRPPIVVDVRRSSRLITIAKNPHETMQGSLSGCVAEVCWVRSLRCPRLVYKFTRARRCLPGPHRTQMRDPYFDILQLAWMITVDFGPAWELACLEKIHLGCAGQN